MVSLPLYNFQIQAKPNPARRMPIRIYIIDDHQIIRDGLRLILGAEQDMEVIGDAAGGQAALEDIAVKSPDLITSDIEMPGIDGISLSRQIKARLPQVRIMILSAHADPHFVREALQAGVVGYLLKINAGNELVHAVRSVMEGQIYLCPEVSTLVVREYQKHVHSPNPTNQGLLSVREREVLRSIADGKTTKQVALALNLSSKTVEAHRLNIMAKLRLNSVAELTKYAIREGIAQL